MPKKLPKWNDAMPGSVEPEYVRALELVHEAAIDLHMTVDKVGVKNKEFHTKLYALLKASNRASKLI